MYTNALYMINGFLGSGKTTFLMHVFEQLKDKKIAVIMNEFGTVSVDSEIIKNYSIEVNEIINGSVFCSCKSDKFVEQLIKINQHDFDYIFVESSGLANPNNLDPLLELVEKKSERGINYKGAIGIIDVQTIHKLIKTAAMVKQQVAVSDLIILNKIDLVDSKRIPMIRALLREYNDTALLVEAQYCNIDQALFIDSLNVLREKKLPPNQMTLGIEKYLIKIPEIITEEQLNHWINQFSSKTYRTKGFVKTTQGTILVQGVSDHLDIYPQKDDTDESYLIVLSFGKEYVLRTIQKEWKKISDQKLIIQERG